MHRVARSVLCPLGLFSLVLIAGIGCGGSGSTASATTGTTGATGATTGTLSTKLVGTVNLGKSPVKAVVNPVTNLQYIADQDSNQVTVVNFATLKLVATIATASSPTDLAINSKTNTIYVSEFGHKIDVISGATNKITATIDTSGAPDYLGDGIGIGVNATTNQFFLATDVSGIASVAIFDGATNKLVADVAVPTSSFTVTDYQAQVFADEPLNKVFVAFGYDNHIVNLDVATKTLTTVTEANPVVELTGDPLNNDVWSLTSAQEGRTATTQDSITDFSSPNGLPSSRHPATAGSNYTLTLPSGFQAHEMIVFVPDSINQGRAITVVGTVSPESSQTALLYYYFHNGHFELFSTGTTPLSITAYSYERFSPSNPFAGNLLLVGIEPSSDSSFSVETVYNISLPPPPGRAYKVQATGGVLNASIKS